MPFELSLESHRHKFILVVKFVHVHLHKLKQVIVRHVVVGRRGGGPRGLLRLRLGSTRDWRLRRGDGEDVRPEVVVDWFWRRAPRARALAA